jgi:16S rRNA (guanine(966)-N(2))-methyltransferase RsmD
MSLRLSGGRRLQSPPGDRARPTAARVRQSVLNILAPRLAGTRWLDLCCGSGVMACEVLQRGAAQVVAVEQDRRIAQVARQNLGAVAAGLGLGPERWQLHCQEVLRWLQRPIPNEGTSRGFDLIYCDPPYRAGLYGPMADGVSAGGWLAPDGLMVWECASAEMPQLPPDWVLEDQRRYGTTSLMVLSCRAGCRGDTGSRRP